MIRAHITLAVALTLVSTSIVQADPSLRTGWFAGAAPRVHVLTGSGYDESPWIVPVVRVVSNSFKTTAHDTIDVASVGAGAGVGIEAQLGYAFTERWAVRGVVSAARHGSDAGSVGTAWFAFDGVHRRALGAIDVTAFVRGGMFTVRFMDVNIDQFPGEPDPDWVFTGPMAGGGVGAAYRLTPRLSLGAEAAWTYVLLRTSVSTDGAGTHTEMPHSFVGSGWGVTPLSVVWHW